MLFCFSSILFFFLIITGLGRLLPALFSFLRFSNPVHYFWCGFALSTALLRLAGLMTPMNGAAAAFVIAAGAAGNFILWRDARRRERPPVSALKMPLMASCAALLCISFTQADAAWSGLAYDTDLYHLAIVNWNKAYAAVPGLAQLNVRLGTDSSFLLLASVFDHWIWDGRSSWFMGGVFTFAAALHFIWEAAAARSEAWKRACALCLLCWIALEASYAIPGLYHDLAANYINAVLIFEALKLCLEKNDEGGAALSGPFLLCMLAASGFTVKAVGAPNILFASALALWLLRKARRLDLKSLARVFAPPFITACGYLAANIIHSGYPFYPSPWFALDLPWTLPDYIINDIYNITKYYPRVHDGEMWREAPKHGFSFWFPGWLWHQVSNAHNIRLSVQALAPLLAGAALWRRGFCAAKMKKTALFFAAWNVADIAFWFAMAPEVRYSTGFFWVFAATAAAFAFYEAKSLPLDQTMTAGPEKAAAAFALLFFVTAAVNTAVYDNRRFSLWGVGEIPPKALEARVLQNGQTPPLRVWTPLEDNRCGNAPLLCTPYPEDNLRLIKPGSLGEGFYREKNAEGKGGKHITPY